MLISTFSCVLQFNKTVRELNDSKKIMFQSVMLRFGDMTRSRTDTVGFGSSFPKKSGHHAALIQAKFFSS
jgi:hypothetical protein